MSLCLSGFIYISVSLSLSTSLSLSLSLSKIQCVTCSMLSFLVYITCNSDLFVSRSLMTTPPPRPGWIWDMRVMAEMWSCVLVVLWGILVFLRLRGNVNNSLVSVCFGKGWCLSSLYFCVLEVMWRILCWCVSAGVWRVFFYVMCGILWPSIHLLLWKLCVKRLCLSTFLCFRSNYLALSTFIFFVLEGVWRVNGCLVKFLSFSRYIKSWV